MSLKLVKSCKITIQISNKIPWLPSTRNWALLLYFTLLYFKIIAQVLLKYEVVIFTLKCTNSRQTGRKLVIEFSNFPLQIREDCQVFS